MFLCGPSAQSLLIACISFSTPSILFRGMYNSFLAKAYSTVSYLPIRTADLSGGNAVELHKSQNFLRQALYFMNFTIPTSANTPPMHQARVFPYRKSNAIVIACSGHSRKQYSVSS